MREQQAVWYAGNSKRYEMQRFAWRGRDDVAAHENGNTKAENADASQILPEENVNTSALSTMHDEKCKRKRMDAAA